MIDGKFKEIIGTPIFKDKNRQKEYCFWKT